MGSDDEYLTPLVEAMLDRQHVLVLVDMTNGSGEVTKPKGWRTLIREIRRPALDVNAYGHLDPVVVVEDDVNDPERSPGLSICLSPRQVIVDPWCGCSDPEYCRRSAARTRTFAARLRGRQDSGRHK